MLFYGGIAGMLIAAVISVIVIAALSGSRKRLRRKMIDEYGSETDAETG
jgi:predicted membrane metal-binding protein